MSLRITWELAILTVEQMAHLKSVVAEAVLLTVMRYLMPMIPGCRNGKRVKSQVAYFTMNPGVS